VFDRDEVLRLWRQGWSYRQIAKSLGFRTGDCRPDAAAVFQKLAVDIVIREGRCAGCSLLMLIGGRL